MALGKKAAGKDRWAVGVDLGGTKINVAAVDGTGGIRGKLNLPTNAGQGPGAVKAALVRAVKDLIAGAKTPPLGVGVGVAGQVAREDGSVKFAPNLGWRNEPFGADLRRSLSLPVLVTNDVRAATWGEWLYGAGRGFRDLVCLYVGTGIGGGVVAGGQVLTGCSNTAGELGHITVDLNGPSCRCGNQGCLEALAGGWAIALAARERVVSDPAGGAALLRGAGGRREDITAKVVAEAARKGDPLAQHLFERAARALAAGAVTLVNAYNPCRIILGGGVIDGMPGLVGKVAEGVRRLALAPAREPLKVIRARLRANAPVVGAAALVLNCPAKDLRSSSRT